MVRPMDFSVITVRGAFDDFAEKRYAYTGSNVEYEGWSAKPNAATDQPIWYIVKYTYAGGLVTRQQLPDDGPYFQYAWDDRATLFS